MGNKWSTTSITGYKANNPPDDGTVTAANQVKYSSITTNLTDPIHSSLTLVISKLDDLFTSGTTSKTGTYTTTTSDHTRALECTGTFTLTLLAAATAGAGYYVTVKNAGSGVITVARDAADTIDGATSVTLAAQDTKKFVVNAAGDGYIGLARTTAELRTSIGGDLVLLNRTVASGAAAVSWDNTIITATYDKYFVTLNDVSFSTTVTFNCQFSTDNGSTWVGGTNNVHTRYGALSSADGLDVSILASTGDDVIIIGSGFTSAYELCGEYWLDFASRSTIRGNIAFAAGGVTQGSLNNWGQIASTANAVRFVLNTGTMSGKFAIYGLRIS